MTEQRNRSHLPVGGIRATQCGGNTVGGVIRERSARADGYRHLDTPAMVEMLRRLHANTYVYGVWDTAVDWDDLCDEFAPAAAAAGIDVWIYLVPPSETDRTGGRASRPHVMDYVAWARACAELSVRCPNVRAWAIDDFEFDLNAKLFTPAYMEEMRQTAAAINPYLAFYTCAYWHAATSEAFLDKYAPYIDGIIYPYLDGDNHNTQEAGSVGECLDEILLHTDPRGLELVLLVYTGRFLDACLEPSDRYSAEAVRTGLEYARAGKIAGVTAYGLQVDGAPAVRGSNRAMYGNGRLSLSVPPRGTVAGQYAQASQVVGVDPGMPRYELSFWHFDTFTARMGTEGRHIKQVLIDGEVIWEEDAVWHGFALWQQCSTLHGPIDVTSWVAGKATVELTFRLLERTGSPDRFPIDVGFDNIETIGLEVLDPGFETGDPWTLRREGGIVLAAIDIWAEDQPARNFAAVSGEYRAEARRLQAGAATGVAVEDAPAPVPVR